MRSSPPLFALSLLFSLFLISKSAHAAEDFVFLDATTQLPVNPSANTRDTLDIDLADVDGDGDLDIFAVDGSASLAAFPNRLLINDGLGNFSDQSATRLPPGASNSTEVDFADVDGDGDLDAVISNLGPNQLLLNDGQGHFTDASTQLPQAAPPGPPGFFIGPNFIEISAEARFVDVDGDGDPDIVIANENPLPFGPPGDVNRLLINDGTGRFSEGRGRLPFTIDQGSGFVAGDIDGDGDMDLVQINVGPNNILVNDGRGFFADMSATQLPVNTASSRKGVLGDVDGDGDLDLFVANSRNQQNRLFLNDGHGVFMDATGSLPLRNDTSTDVDLIDLDGDGDLDAYVTNVGDFVGGHGFLGDQNLVLFNDGHGRFSDGTFPRASERAGRSTNAEFGDVDGDGVPDVVVANSGGVSQPGLPPPDGEDRLYLSRPCRTYRATCLQTAVDQLDRELHALDPDPAAGQMVSSRTRVNRTRKGILQRTSRLARRLVDRGRPRLAAFPLAVVRARADGLRRPGDWVTGVAAKRIEAVTDFGIYNAP